MTQNARSAARSLLREYLARFTKHFTEHIWKAGRFDNAGVMQREGNFTIDSVPHRRTTFHALVVTTRAWLAALLNTHAPSE